MDFSVLMARRWIRSAGIVFDWPKNENSLHIVQAVCVHIEQGTPMIGTRSYMELQ
ncbi:hypothetical protein PCURB6_31450 [Paenibacillus curdlanolyticus]|nr:hypothetical protein PCURB6_31450 [Paenibacillus curdlanolyticus]